MLISPPFLPPRGNQTEEQWFETAMSGGRPGAGAYPVSAQLDWHGGIHLTAPMNGTTAEPVRAIADGMVVFVREPTRTDDPKHPLCYGGGYTSDGAVVIRHDTEIGANAQGQPITVRFYSIYHHLFNIRPTVMKNRQIWRKDPIGQAGHIYGIPNQIHFEIRCDEANLQRLIGRAAGNLALDRDGRTDVVYGEMYFLLPAGTPVYGQRPLLNDPVARAALSSSRAPAAPVTLQPVTTTAEQMVVGLFYASGRGEAGHYGDAFIRSYRMDGSNYGPARIEPEAEYRLYQDCMEINRSYPADSQPAPSAVLELLRFGRIIGPDPLTPADVPHWRQVTYASGTGWVNLNAANVRKYSDADFPQWKNWKLIADDMNNDARCDSPTLKSWLNQDANDSVDPIAGFLALSQNTVNERMKKTICKIPCEWDSSSIDRRWSWLHEGGGNSAKSMSTTDYEDFKKHVLSLCLDLPEILNANWTFNPATFISHHSKHYWIDEVFFKKLYPRATPENIRRFRQKINMTFNKYLITGSRRISHFLGQAGVESGQLLWTSETYNGNANDYFRNYEKAKNYAGWLGNVQWNDGARFRGRGLKQLTGRDNYTNYWLYRGWIRSNSFSPRWWRNPGWWGVSTAEVRPSQFNALPIQDEGRTGQLIATMRPPAIQNPEVVATDAFTCVDTAGWFWAKNRLLQIADGGDVAEMTRRVRGDSQDTGRTLPWPAAAHYPERVSQTNSISTLLGDSQ